jgi:hypothetical protein
VRFVALLLCLVLVAAAVPAQSSDDGFRISYVAGSRDDAGVFMGGTELRILAPYEGKLYAGNGYWEDRPGAEGRQGAEVLVLDRRDGRWKVDHVFPRRDFAVSALRGVTFRTDRSGDALAVPVSLLLASAWDTTGTTQVFSRDDGTGTWSAATLAEDRYDAAANFLPQIRSLGFHHDRLTGVDRVFAGDAPRGIFSGVYDPSVPGRIRWDALPELDTIALPAGASPGLAGRARVANFAECNGVLYATVGQQIWARDDGTAAHWRAVYTNESAAYTETGLRGLTAVPNPTGTGDVLLAAVEGDSPRILRFDPASGNAATDLDLAAFLNKAWKTRVSYVIAAYNDMVRLSDPQLGNVVLMGIEAFIPSSSPVPAGHVLVDFVQPNKSGHIEGGAWYLVRHPDGRYDLRQVTADGARVATRSIVASPFANDDALYFAGYDANGMPIHNSAWIARASTNVALGEAPASGR